MAMVVHGCRLEMLSVLLFQALVPIPAHQVRLLKLDGLFHPRVSIENLSATDSELDTIRTPWHVGSSSVEHWTPDEIVKKYAVAHRRAEKRQASGIVRPNVVWVHMHKYAGTWVCHTAKKQGEVAGPNNCNWPGDGCWGNMGKVNISGEAEPHKARCPEREANPTITFSMIERPLEVGDLACKEALRGIIVRSPQLAVKSIASFENLTEAELASFLLQVQSGAQSFRRSANTPERDIWHRQLDNFMVRTLSGDFWAPVGQLTRKHLKAAISTLRRMDVIIPLEHLRDHIVQFEKVLKWDAAEIEASDSRNKNGATENHDYYDKGYSANVLKEIKKLNSLDEKLYSLACELAEKRSRSLQHESKS